MIVTLNLQTSFKVNVYPLIKSPVAEVWPDWTKGEEIFQGQNVSFHSAIHFTFDIESKFKVTAHPLFKSCDYEKFEPNMALFFLFDIFITHVIQ